ncbi:MULTISPECIES: hypothetical protein [Sorangium]|uniref:Secreted protein n=1 Tax=Sorangium cellulosum TaxID=56 RepID=A0A4P2QJP8_SORCE|nr:MULTISPECIES: hypothetical protein [Sorangium]AUX30219.1 hypothetical protein SOCE836_023170 [Sorangium cellulosum]WCQ89610.1 hypothetical protein NQZ70_02301 [Sorangium sp. Soce836]
MKKLMILASLAVMSISGSAMAVAPTAGRQIVIEGRPAGTAQFLPAGLGPAINLLAPNGTCRSNMIWTSVNPVSGSLLCQTLETRTVTNPNCPAANITTTMYAGDGLTACNGFDQNGFPFSAIFMALGESATANPTFTGTILMNTMPFVQGMLIR